MKHFSSVLAVSTATLLVIAGCAQPAQPTPAPAPQPEAKPVVTQEDVSSKASLEIKAPAEEIKFETYEAKEYGFQIKYPEGWRVKDDDVHGKGIIVTSNDDPKDTEWGGMNLNIHVDALSGDWGMGWKTVKTDHYVNWTGTTFELSYNEPDLTITEPFSPDTRSVDISTKLVPGLVRFSYDEKKNPNAVEVLKMLLEGFIPMS